MTNKITKGKSYGKFTRSAEEGKTDYTLIPRFCLDRLAGLYTKGAEVHGKDNWKEDTSKETLERAKRSAWRHFLALMDGETDEDHYAALIFNITQIEYIKCKDL